VAIAHPQPERSSSLLFGRLSPRSLKLRETVPPAIAMSFAVDPVAEGIRFPPGPIESDEPPLESDLHRDQIDLLIRLLRWWWRERDDVYISGNLTVYYDEQQLKRRNFRGPDFFVVLGAEKRDRLSWVVWHEGGCYPDVIIELLSPTTAEVDRTTKKELYQNIFRTPNYFWFDPVSLEFCGFHFVRGLYQPLEPNERGWLWSEPLNLFLGIDNRKLRFFTPEGVLVLLPEEELGQQVEQERLRVEQERLRAEQECLRAERAEAELARLRAQLAGDAPREP